MSKVDFYVCPNGVCLDGEKYEALNKFIKVVNDCWQTFVQGIRALAGFIKRAFEKSAAFIKPQPPKKPPKEAYPLVRKISMKSQGYIRPVRIKVRTNC